MHLFQWQWGARDSHGIIAFQHLADQSIVFTTHAGRLFRVRPVSNGPAELLDLGWFHPDGEAYAPALFTTDGKRYVVGIASREYGDAKNFAWVRYDLDGGQSTAMPLVYPRYEGRPRSLSHRLYGCHTTDDVGAY